MPTHGSFPVPLSDAPLLAQPFIGRVCAGFPSPAGDLGAQRIDLTKVLIGAKHVVTLWNDDAIEDNNWAFVL